MSLIKCRITQDYCYNDDYGNCHDCDVAKNNTTYLKPCPFCGNTKTVVTNCRELGECKKFVKCTKQGYIAVVCDFNKGGCGACGGYRATLKEAIAAWNRRAGGSDE